MEADDVVSNSQDGEPLLAFEDRVPDFSVDHLFLAMTFLSR